MKTSNAIAFAAVAAALIGPAPLFAQNVKKACMADVQRMCPTATPGRGMTMHCIKGRMSEVSPGCSAAIQAAKASRAARRAAAAQNPAGAPPAPGAAPPPGAPQMR
jgi:hypothetical protein